MESNEELFNQIYPLACRYLHADTENADEAFFDDLKRYFSILAEVTNFKAYYQFISIGEFFSLADEKTSEDLSFYLDDCENAVVIASTLGLGVDSKAARLMKDDMAGAVIFDALASALLEIKTDEFEEGLDLGPHTFRFAPGYGDIPIELNDILIDSLSLQKRIGLSKTANSLMIPQKSMIAVCGIGKAMAPVCGHCPRLNSCSLRKENLRCYSC